MTVATSIGLPGLTRGEQIGGMMNSTAGKYNSTIQTNNHELMMVDIRYINITQYKILYQLCPHQVCQKEESSLQALLQQALSEPSP